MIRIALSAAALAAFAMAGSVSARADEPSADKPAAEKAEVTKGQKRLAKLLDGRVAGEPRQCINDYPSRGFEIIDGTALVYRVGQTVWVNHTHHPESIDDDDTLVIRRYGSQLCSTDIVTTIDRISGFYTGNVFLSEFVPYRLPKKEG